MHTLWDNRLVPFRCLVVRGESFAPTPGILDSTVTHDTHRRFMANGGHARPKEACMLVMPALGALFSAVIHTIPAFTTIEPSVVVCDNGSVVIHDTRNIFIRLTTCFPGCFGPVVSRQ